MSPLTELKSSSTDDAISEDNNDPSRPKLASQSSNMTQASFSSLIDYHPNTSQTQRIEDYEDDVDETCATSTAKTVRHANHDPSLQIILANIQTVTY
jgi:hypothetical protein